MALNGTGPDQSGAETPGNTLPAAPCTVEGRPPVAATATDSRLTTAYELISSGRIRALTLDIFDTLLWRTVPRPVDAFTLVGRQLAELGLLHDSVAPAAFARLRIAAEVRARRLSRARGDGPEVLLRDIYRLMPSSVVRSQSADVLVSVEVEAERHITVPDLDIVQLLRFAGEDQGLKVALVSNTYFTSGQLRQLLARSPIENLTIDLVFSSGSEGCSKGDGLFERVLAELAIPAESVLHIGDDPDADVAAGAELGMHTGLFPRLDKDLRRMVEAEGVSVVGDDPQRRDVIDEEHGDWGLTSLRGKVLAQAGGRGQLPSVLPYWRYGAAVLGPPLAGFAEWVHERAGSYGADQVFCMMREGEFLSALINNAATGTSNAVPAAPIWLSRYVAARAAIVSVSREELRDFLSRRRVQPTLGAFCSELGVRLADIPELRQLAGERLGSGPLVETLLDHLLSRPDLVQCIRDHTAAARHRLALYISRTVGRDDGVLALVDVGWGASIQRYLATALPAAGLNYRIVGLYMMSNEAAAAGMLDGLEIHAYLSTIGQPADLARPIERSPEIIEQACLAATGSLLDFDADLNPVLDSFRASGLQTLQKRAVQNGVTAFVLERRRYRRAGLGDALHFGGGEGTALLTILRRSVTRPSRDEAAMFAGWAHEDNFGADSQEPIVPRRLARAVPYMTPSDLGRLSMSDCYWPNGLAAMYDENLALSAAALVEGLVPEGAFSSSRLGEAMTLLGDTGAGIGDGRGPVAAGRRQANGNGLSYVRLVIEGPSLHSATLRPGQLPCVVRFDWIHLTAWPAGAPGPIEAFIEDEDGFAALTYGDGVRLYDGVIACPKHPEVRIHLAPLVGSNVRRLEVEAGFAVLPLYGTVPSIVGGHIGAAVRARAERLRVRLAEEFTDGGPTAVMRGGARWVGRRRGMR